MADHQERYVFPAVLKLNDPDFRNRCALWASQTRRDIAELIAGSRDQIVISQQLLSEVDRILSKR